MVGVRELVIEYSDRVPDVGSDVLAVVFPGAEVASVSAPLRIGLSMPLLGGARAEVWRTELPVERGVDGPVVWSSAGDLLIGAMAVADSGSIAARAEEAYRTLIPFVRRAGFPSIVRMWNQVPRILENEDGLERYQAFCAGRATGFEAYGFKLEGDLPAASAVGSDGEGFVVTVLASRGKVEYFENPRQVSAFHYPRRYGPRSPSFARASRVELGGEALILVSGTASIVGHASLHADDVRAQIDETVENLRLVYGAASRRELRCLSDVRGALYRIYVKCPADLEPIRERFAPRIASDASCLWLRGDICRDELLVEVEMIGRE
jgi:chorismate lyase/3-hydroxybenzoate synthase